LVGGDPGPDRRWRDAWQRHVGNEVDLEGLLAGLAGGTLVSSLEERAAEGESRGGVWIDGVEIGFGELAEGAGRVAGSLRRAGLCPGKRVLVVGGTSPGLVRAYLGVLVAGGVAVLADPVLTQAELAQVVCDSGAGLALVPPGSRAAAHLNGITGLRGVLPLDLGLEEPGGGAPPAGPEPGSPAVLAYTSGSTGVPKGVPLTHSNLVSSIRGAMAAWRWSRDDVLVHSLPLTHQHGLGGFHAALLSGARVAILSRFDPARLCQAAAALGATVLFAVPAMYERLVALPARHLASLRELRLAVSGSAPLSPGLFERVAVALGQPPLERYGTTESGLDVSNLYEGPRVPGAVGLPLPGVELAIEEASGEILLRGPQVFGGYWGDAEATREAFTGDGWFRTGDLGTLDPRTGCLAITGRKKELIVTGGLNVSPREVELALETHPGVAEAAVAGRPSAKWGEEVTAWVVARPGVVVAPGEVLLHARERLAPYKVPKRVFIVSRLPRSRVGKLLRDRLVPPPQ
jgi:malonyl-CoA/methylmalonyl-CoA synthetase